MSSSESNDLNTSGKGEASSDLNDSKLPLEKRKMILSDNINSSDMDASSSNNLISSECSDDDDIPNTNNSSEFTGARNRTPTQQMLREKNTNAARQSRHKAKKREQNLHKNAKKIQEENLLAKQKIAAQIVYANQLLGLLGLEEEADWNAAWKRTLE